MLQEHLLYDSVVANRLHVISVPENVAATTQLLLTAHFMRGFGRPQLPVPETNPIMMPDPIV